MAVPRAELTVTTPPLLTSIAPLENLRSIEAADDTLVSITTGENVTELGNLLGRLSSAGGILGLDIDSPVDTLSVTAAGLFDVIVVSGSSGPRAMVLAGSGGDLERFTARSLGIDSLTLTGVANIDRLELDSGTLRVFEAPDVSTAGVVSITGADLETIAMTGLGTVDGLSISGGTHLGFSSLRTVRGTLSVSSPTISTLGTFSGVTALGVDIAPGDGTSALVLRDLPLVTSLSNFGVSLPEFADHQRVCIRTTGIRRAALDEFCGRVFADRLACEDGCN